MNGHFVAPLPGYDLGSWARQLTVELERVLGAGEETMGNTSYTNIRAVVATAGTTLLVVPQRVGVKLGKILATDPNGSGATFSLFLVPRGDNQGPMHELYSATSVGTGPLVLSGLAGVVMDSGDVLAAQASSDGDVVLWVSLETFSND